jgi:hypothetical protein
MMYHESFQYRPPIDRMRRRDRDAALPHVLQRYEEESGVGKQMNNKRERRVKNIALLKAKDDMTSSHHVGATLTRRVSA